MDAATTQQIADPKVPTHVAIIMDGNGRWAKKRALGRLKGHEKGAEAVREALKGCKDLGIQYLTLFAFSSENWSRPPEEISHLMGLFRYFFKKELKTLLETGIRVKFIGNIQKLPEDIQQLANQVVEDSKLNTELVLTIALSYGSQSEIAAAVRKISERVEAGELKPADVTEDLIHQNLDTADTPDPDLLIRTSGEKRLSNFLLWQSAYTELIFLDVLWPDFTRSDLEDAVAEYAGRCRRFGAL
ncbi:isoprenyl transferase [Sneathiella marina]|uniref:Isoprenyl transferase n=1 Tax=Sneathiella marina TaxID=2950108 RepID=A0ABY4VXG2_9PROT|nr:isoprenyl transferase [Sneathiella marina]USG59616.1 isoprenyl transferase [Sneathiella marina]